MGAPAFLQQQATGQQEASLRSPKEGWQVRGLKGRRSGGSRVGIPAPPPTPDVVSGPGPEPLQPLTWGQVRAPSLDSGENSVRFKVRCDMTSMKFTVEIKSLKPRLPDDGDKCEHWHPKYDMQSMAGQEEVWGHSWPPQHLCWNSRRKESSGKVSYWPTPPFHLPPPHHPHTAAFLEGERFTNHPAGESRRIKHT